MFAAFMTQTFVFATKKRSGSLFQREDYVGKFDLAGVCPPNSVMYVRK